MTFAPGLHGAACVVFLAYTLAHYCLAQARTDGQRLQFVQSPHSSSSLQQHQQQHQPLHRPTEAGSAAPPLACDCHIMQNSHRLRLGSHQYAALPWAAGQPLDHGGGRSGAASLAFSVAWTLEQP